MKKYDQLIFEGFNPTISNSETTQNSHIYKSTEEISGKKPKFVILRNNTKHKCSKCGLVDDTMYALGNVFCEQCLPYKPYLVRKKRNLNGGYLKYGSITRELTKDNLIDLYHHQKKSLQDIAKGCKCTRQMVKSLMEGQARGVKSCFLYSAFSNPLNSPYHHPHCPHYPYSSQTTEK